MMYSKPGRVKICRGERVFQAEKKEQAKMRSVLGKASSETIMNESVWFKQRTKLIYSFNEEVDWPKGFRVLIINTIGNH